MRPIAGAIASFAALLSIAPPAAALTPAQVSAGFRQGVVNYCLEAALAGTDLAHLSDEARRGISPASESMRSMVEDSNPSGPIWDVKSAAGIVLISEPTSGVCDVFAYGPPVDRTFKATLADARKRTPGLAPTAVTPGYNPIVYRLQAIQGSIAISIDLNGAEPGTPGRLFRFSMLNARVTREAH